MKTLFFFLVLTLTLSLNAQITKGNWLVGGSGSFSSTTATSEDNLGNEIKITGTGARINPNIGYFFADKFAVGLDLSVSFANSQGPNNSNWSIGFGPFARYYFLKLENRINIFSEVNFLYSTGLSEINNDRKSTIIGFSTGCTLFFNSSVGLELSLNYTDSTNKENRSVDSKFNQFFIGLGFQIHLEK